MSSVSKTHALKFEAVNGPGAKISDDALAPVATHHTLLLLVTDRFHAETAIRSINSDITQVPHSSRMVWLTSKDIESHCPSYFPSRSP